MKKIIASIAAWLMLASPVFADPTGANVTPGNAGSQSSAAGCVYRSSPPAPTNGQQMGLGCDANGNLIINASGGGTITANQGNGGSSGQAWFTQAAAGAFLDGWSVTQGLQADTACATDNGTCTEQALLKRLNQNITTLLNALQATPSVAVPSGTPPYNLTFSTYTFNRPSNVLSYAANYYVANSTTAGSVVPISFTNVVGANGGCTSGIEVRMRWGLGSNATVPPTVSVWISNAALTLTVGDGGVFPGANTGYGSLQLFLSVASCENSGDGDYCYSGLVTNPVCAASNSRSLYVYPVIGGAYTPTSGQQITVELIARQN
jgi:hypothetical protein